MASYSEIFNTNFKVLKTIGLWNIKTNNATKNQIYFFYQIFMLLFVTLFIILELFDLYFISHDFEKFNFNLCSTITTSITFFKTLVSLRKLPEINQLRKNLNKYAEDVQDEECKKIVGKAAWEMKFLNKLFYGMSGGLVTVWLLTPLLDYRKGARKLPFRQYFPFELQASPNYELTYLYQVFSCFIISSNIISSDLATFGFLISISCEYEILKKKIQKLNEYFEKRESKEWVVEKGENVDEETLRIIKDMIRTHQQILLRIKQFEEIFNKSVMLQFLGVTFLLAVVGADVMFVSTEFNSRFVTQLGYLCVALTDLFFYCFYGTRLQFKSYDIVDCTFSAPWYLIKAKFRSYLSLMIARAQNPPIVTGGKLLPINFTAYLKVLKNTYNMLALFSQVAAKSKKLNGNE